MSVELGLGDGRVCETPVGERLLVFGSVKDGLDGPLQSRRQWRTPFQADGGDVVRSGIHLRSQERERIRLLFLSPNQLGRVCKDAVNPPGRQLGQSVLDVGQRHSIDGGFTLLRAGPVRDVGQVLQLGGGALGDG